MRVLLRTKSVCPECKRLIGAQLITDGEKVYMSKKCPSHGDFREYVYRYDAYKKVMRYYKFSFGTKRDVYVKGCPYVCEKCSQHMSKTCLAVIDLTSRCNMRCKYCFASANARPYEPSCEKIKEMISFLRKAQPTCNAILFSGGEPTIRKDFFEILDHARAERFDCLMVATNGLKIAKEKGYAQELIDHGVGVLYLSFDGFSDRTNPYKKSYTYIKDIIRNCERTNPQIAIMLVPTIARGKNDSEVWSIVNFAIKNSHVIRGVNFQPIGFSGRADHNESERYTTPDLFDDLEAQSGGTIRASDFYPINTCVPLVNFMQAISGGEFTNFTMHPMCGAATYVFIENGKIIPITEFIDVERFVAVCNKYSKRFKGEGGLRGAILTAQFISEIYGVVKKKLKILPLMANVIANRDYESLKRFHWNTLFIGSMHFQDCFNMDLQRLQRCGVHYVTPNMSIVPFCAYNNLGYREQIESAFSKCGQETLGYKLVDQT